MDLRVRILIVIVTLLTVIGGITYDSYFNAPSRFTVRHETLDSAVIPKQMDEVNILFFSDLHYGTFMDKERASLLIDEINHTSPDIVIFGGDLLDKQISSAEADALVELLGQIKAPLGKFAVYGDYDHQSDQILNQVNNIYTRSTFEILNNRSIIVRNKGSQGITLVGIDSSYKGEPDVTAAFYSVSPLSYTIAVSHTPDTAAYIPGEKTNLFLAGHSHGGQINYLVGSAYNPPGSQKYFSGKTNVDNQYTIDITDGVGTTITDVRFLTNAEIVVYQLNHKSMDTQ